MRVILVNMLIGMAMGIVLGAAGVTIATWQFWVAMCLLAATILNTGITERRPS